MGDSSFTIFTSIRYDTDLCKVAGNKLLEHAGWNFRNASPLYMLDYHRDRMLRAAKFWKWSDAVLVLQSDAALSQISSSVLNLVHAHGIENQPQRIRISLSEKGDISYQSFPTTKADVACLFPAVLAPPQLEHDGSSVEAPLTLFVDSGLTDSSEFTHFKTTKRQCYDAARSRVHLNPAANAEVLLVNSRDKTIMEGSIMTPYFWRNGRWVTPPVSHDYNPCLGSGGQDGTTRRWALERHLAVEEAVEVSSLTQDESCWVSNGVRGFRRGIVKLGGSQ